MLQVLIAGTLDSHESNAVMGAGRVKTDNVHVLAIPPQLLCVHLYYSSCFLQTAHWPCLQHEKSTELNDREEGRVRGKGNDTPLTGWVSLLSVASPPPSSPPDCVCVHWRRNCKENKFAVKSLSKS